MVIAMEVIPLAAMVAIVISVFGMAFPKGTLVVVTGSIAAIAHEA